MTWAKHGEKYAQIVEDEAFRRAQELTEGSSA